MGSVARGLVEIVAPPTIRGVDRLEGVESPVIFAPNHQSHVDTPIVLSCLPRRFRRATVVAAGADYFFDRALKAAVSAAILGAIPVDRERVNRRSSDLARDLLDDGWNLVIFPEGGRSPDGWAQPFRGGAAYLSIRTNRPVVPLHLSGTRRVHTRGERKIRRSPTVVTFGSPMLARVDEDIRRFNRRIEQSVEMLGDEASTDWWSSRLRAHTGTTPALRGPDVAPWRRAWELGSSGRSPRSRTWPYL